MRRLSIIFFCIFSIVTAKAQHPTVKNFDKETYKAGAQTWHIQQDESGNMAFANSGILEYDGTEWGLTWTGNRTTVRSLMYDQESGRLYFGAANEFGFLNIDNENHKKYVIFTEGVNHAMEDIWAIHKISNHLWLRESNNMYRYDFKELKQICFPDKISCSAELEGRLLIFVNNNGVFSLEGEDNFMKVPGTEALDGKRVVSILPYKGNVMFVCSDGVIFLFRQGILKEYDSGCRKELAAATVYCSTINQHYLALGTVSDGVYIQDITSGEVMHLNTYSGLQNNTVLSLYFDRDDNLWLGLDKGIDLIFLNSAEYSVFGNPDRFGAGYASVVHDGNIWLGTNQGLYRAPYTEGGAIPKDDEFVNIDSVKGQVWSLLAYDGTLFCCHDRGIYIIKDRKCRHIPLNGAWKLERLREWPGFLLGSSYDRLFLLKKNGNRWEFDAWISGFEDASKAFEEDSDGTIWFSHWIKGLFKLSLDMNTKSITHTQFMSRNNGFPEDWSNIPVEIDNDVIFRTARGYYRYDKYSDKAHPIERTDILESPALKSLAAKRMQGFDDIRNLTDEEILVNTEDGFSIVRTGKLDEILERRLPQVYIKEIMSDAVLYNSMSASRDSSSMLELPYGSNTLMVRAACPDYDGINLEFSFMLEGYDKQWSQFSQSNRKEYTGLPHGEYVLRVRARDDIHSNMTETAIPITICAPWYYSTMAIVIYIIILIMMIASIYRLMYRYSIKRARHISMKKEEELRKKQMRLDLEHKAQDLAASTMNVIRKNEILLDIDAKLEKVVENMADDRNRSLKIVGKIRHQIRENIQHDDVWKKFEKNFDIVYDDFLKRLGEKYPQLTMSDKKMCAYLKMELSSKEIAPLMNITVRSVEMTRYRLRKKLGLCREDNLTEFLQKF